jgi:hypothetical protein
VRLDAAFPRQVGITLGILVLVSAYPLMKVGSQEVLVAVLAGVLISTINVLLGFLAIEYSIGKSYTTFLNAVLGGMGIRIGLMLTMMFVLIRFAGLHRVAFAVALLGSYLVFLVLEIVFIQKKVETKSQG